MRSDHHHKKPNKISPKHLTTTHQIDDNEPMNNTPEPTYQWDTILTHRTNTAARPRP